MSEINWTHVTTTLGELQAWDGNPKKSTKKQKQQIAASFDELGQFSTVAISPDGDVYDGHQRLSALLAKYGDGYEVKALQSSRPLTDEERRKIAIYSRQIGAWDWDALMDWDAYDLHEWGFDDSMLADLTADGDALGAMLEGMDFEPVAGEEWGDSFDKLPDEDRAPFQQMTFTLHDTQVEQVKTAMQLAKTMGAFDSENENGNGNALARICETYITDNG